MFSNWWWSTNKTHASCFLLNYDESYNELTEKCRSCKIIVSHILFIILFVLYVEFCSFKLLVAIDQQHERKLLNQNYTWMQLLLPLMNRNLCWCLDDVFFCEINIQISLVMFIGQIHCISFIIYHQHTKIKRKSRKPAYCIWGIPMAKISCPHPPASSTENTICTENKVFSSSDRQNGLLPLQSTRNTFCWDERVVNYCRRCCC